MPRNQRSVSFVVATYRRPDVLRQCLKMISDLTQRVHACQVDVRVYDNGAPHDSRLVVEEFRTRLDLVYSLNEPGHGLGYSLRRGCAEATGDIIVELNDDALVPGDFLDQIHELFATDQKIGVVGVRAIEKGYAANGNRIGIIDPATVSVVGNFDQVTDSPIDVEHVYGFCYAYRSEILERGATHDAILLSKDYSSGNRIETDHCLTARRLGYRVVYDGRIAVQHLAKPRADMDELSLKWKLNHWRNTLYLFLKHFGWFGRNAIAFRFALSDLGLLSFLRKPNRNNWLYFWTGIRARCSAVGHWFSYLCSTKTWKPLKETQQS